MPNLPAWLIEKTISHRQFRPFRQGLAPCGDFFQDDHPCLTHLEDSRCERLHGEVLAQITTGHAMRQEPVPARAISREHATNAQGRNPWVHEKNIVKPGSALINLANAKGGRDNIAVVLIRAMDAPDKAGKLSRWLVG